MKLVSKKNGTTTIFPSLISAVARKIGFTPPTGMSATNAQDAIEEVNSTKYRIITRNEQKTTTASEGWFYPTLNSGEILLGAYTSGGYFAFLRNDGSGNQVFQVTLYNATNGTFAKVTGYSIVLTLIIAKP